MFYVICTFHVRLTLYYDRNALGLETCVAPGAVEWAQFIPGWMTLRPLNRALVSFG